MVALGLICHNHYCLHHLFSDDHCDVALSLKFLSYIAGNTIAHTLEWIYRLYMIEWCSGALG